mmetsp:Transcript_87369/g.227938  ORF Transcript_87369/g.227938 Transcript_87369/m.227938 type:complete len:264 (+) Transcript_87369:405-1196(+)
MRPLEVPTMAQSSAASQGSWPSRLPSQPSPAAKTSGSSLRPCARPSAAATRTRSSQASGTPKPLASCPLLEFPSEHPAMRPPNLCSSMALHPSAPELWHATAVSCSPSPRTAGQSASANTSLGRLRSSAAEYTLTPSVTTKFRPDASQERPLGSRCGWGQEAATSSGRTTWSGLAWPISEPIERSDGLDCIAILACATTGALWRSGTRCTMRPWCPGIERPVVRSSPISRSPSSLPTSHVSLTLCSTSNGMSMSHVSETPRRW